MVCDSRVGYSLGVYVFFSDMCRSLDPLPKFRVYRHNKKGRALLDCWSFAPRLQRVHNSSLIELLRWEVLTLAASK